MKTKPHIFYIRGDRVLQHVHSAHGDAFIKAGPGTGITPVVAINETIALVYWCVIETGGKLEDGRTPGKAYMGDGRIVKLCDTKREAKDLVRAYKSVKPFMAPPLRVERRWCYISAATVDESVRPIDEHLHRAEELVAEYAALEGSNELPKRQRRAVQK